MVGTAKSYRTLKPPFPPGYAVFAELAQILGMRGTLVVLVERRRLIGTIRPAKRKKSIRRSS